MNWTDQGSNELLFNSARVLDYRSISDSGNLILGPATVVSGRNNAGKSALIRAICHLQFGMMNVEADDIRIGSSQAQVMIDCAPLFEGYLRRLNPDLPDGEHLSVFASWTAGGHGRLQVSWNQGQAANSSTHLPRLRSSSSIVPILSSRRTGSYERNVSSDSGQNVSLSDREITSRVFSLSSGRHKEGERFRELCDQVLGLNIATFLNQDGQEPGLALSADNGISLARMGQGVSATLKFLSEVTYDRPRLFCIEEPENDLHPEALRQLLRVILDAIERGNQFLVSTHNAQVLRTLGSVGDSRLYEAFMEYDPSGIPTTTYSAVKGRHDRSNLLADLGYESVVPAGWLLLEESTAEQLVDEFLIPHFAPRLRAVRTVSARGVDRLKRSADDYIRLSTYAHLGQARDRLWILIDGDEAGQRVKRKLEDPSNLTPIAPGRVRVNGPGDLEDCYPARFDQQVAEVRSCTGEQKREAKWRLVREVITWSLGNPSEAVGEFAQSAPELIAALRQIESEFDALPDLPAD